MRILFLFIFLVLASGSEGSPPPPFQRILKQENEETETQAAEPILVEGKKVNEMNEEETREFLQEKIQTLSQGDGEVEMLRIAPGYPLTLSFTEFPTHVVMGDSKMLGYQKIGKTLVLCAMTREGDTSLQVFFSGGKLRVYHLFIEPHFGSAQTAVRVAAFSKKKMSWKESIPENDSSLRWDSFKEVLDVVRNYDLCFKIRGSQKERFNESIFFRPSRYSGFFYFSLYRFLNGPVAITFSYQNPYSQAIRIYESKMRIELGDQLFIPDYLSLHQTFLLPGEKTTGIMILKHPPFQNDQPFELVCR